MRLFSLLLAFQLLCNYCQANSSDELTITHYQSHARYELGIKILELALSKLNQRYQLHIPITEEINEARGENYVINGTLDLQFMIATPERERSMISVKFPIYRGMLGARLLLVTPQQHEQIKAVRTKEDLKQLTAGHGAHWKDLGVYAANELPVITNVEYHALFKQLKTQRFDYFHRGILEIWQEQKLHQDELLVADDIMLFYFQPTYFYVSKSRPELAALLEKGLNAALKDGSYQALLEKYTAPFIKRANLADRTLIYLHNPNVPKTINLDMSWWLPKKHEQTINTQY